MGRGLGAAALGIVVSAALVTVACGGGSSGGVSETQADQEAPGSPSASLLPVTPDALPRFDVERFHRLLRQLRGTPVVVNVWASWCGPCTREAPDLARVARRFEGRVQFVGVDIVDDVSSARAFIHRFGWPYPSVFDATGAIRDDLGFVGQPVTVVFDAEGNRAFSWSGEISADLLTRELSRVVQAARDATG